MKTMLNKKKNAGKDPGMSEHKRKNSKSWSLTQMMIITDFTYLFQSK